MIPAFKVQLPNNLSGKFLDTLVQKVTIFFFFIWFIIFKYNTTVHNFGDEDEIMLWSEANGYWGLNIQPCITWSQSKIWESWSTSVCYSSNDVARWHYNVICGLCTPRWRRMALTLNITLHIKSIQVVKQVLTNSVSDQYRRSTQHYLHGRVNPPWHPPTSTDQQVKWTLWFRVHCDILWSKETKAAQMKRKHQVYPHSGGYHHNTNQKEVQRKARQTYRKKSHRAGATDGSTTPYTSRPGNWKPFWRILSFQRRD